MNACAGIFSFRREVSGTVCAGAVGTAVFALAALLPDAAVDVIFCRGPAHLAAAYFGAAAEGSAFALADGRVVAVTRACGGMGFFAMLCGLLARRAAAGGGGGLRSFPGAVAAAWGYTVLVNGLRIVGTVWVRALAETALPERMWGAAHLAAGVMVFFPALAVAWWGMGKGVTQSGTGQ
jgi:exosortase/archaeosortase family protein